MMSYAKADLDKFKKLIDKSSHILIIQPERIDPDSMGSALALNQLLSDQGKKVSLFAPAKVPDYCQHFPSWKSIDTHVPAGFDMTILVDCGGPTQLQSTIDEYKDKFAAKPFVVIDHHASRESMPFETLELIDTAAGASGQQVTELAEHFGWRLNADSAYGLAAAIKADTLDLSTPNITERTPLALATLMRAGADLEKVRFGMEDAGALTTAELPLKLKFLNRTQFFADNQIALTYITKEEYDSLGADSVVDDQTKHELRRIKEVLVAGVITEREPGVFKVSMRANAPVAGVVAKKLGGGGHDKAASGFMEAKDAKTVITKVVKMLSEELSKL